MAIAPKKINYDVAIKSTNHTRSYSLPPEVYTSDTAVQFRFNILDVEAAEFTEGAAVSTVEITTRDGSFFQHVGETSLEGTTVVYDLKEAEGNHAGLAKIQLKINLGGDYFTSDEYEFKILNSIATGVPVEIYVQNWDTLTAQANAYLTKMAADIEDFDVALETGVLATNIAAKLMSLETTYAPEIVSMKQQLEQAATKAELSAIATPKAVTLAAQMTDVTKIYVYTGVEGGYVSGNWYYHNGTGWVSGGIYQTTGIGDSSVSMGMLKDSAKNGIYDEINPLRQYGYYTDAGVFKTNAAYVGFKVSVTSGDLIRFTNYLTATSIVSAVFTKSDGTKISQINTIDINQFVTRTVNVPIDAAFLLINNHVTFAYDCTVYKFLSLTQYAEKTSIVKIPKWNITASSQVLTSDVIEVNEGDVFTVDGTVFIQPKVSIYSDIGLTTLLSSNATGTNPLVVGTDGYAVFTTIWQGGGYASTISAAKANDYCSLISTYNPIDIYGKKTYALEKTLSGFNTYTLSDKTIVCFGDSLFHFGDGDGTAIADVVRNVTGATVYSAGFGGTRMSASRTLDTPINIAYDKFDFVNLVDAIVSGDYTAQESVYANLGNNDPVDYKNRIDRLKTIDFTQVDIITFSHATNDWRAGVALDGTTISTYKGALSSAITKLQNAYPNIRIVALTPFWRILHDGTAYTQNADTHLVNGKTLLDFKKVLYDVGQGVYHLQVIDVYNLGFNINNHTLYYMDGTHFQANGRKIAGESMGRQLISN